VESYSCCSIFMSNLGQLATDLDIFCTREFSMIELADEFSGTSSFMPQKKNPLPLEAIRAYSGYFIGILPSILGVMKTNSEEVDIIEFTPDFTSGVFKMLVNMAELMEGVVATMIINEGEMRENVKSNWSAASTLALLISRKANLSWRTAHRIVGLLVKDAIEKGITPMQVTSQMLNKAAQEIIGGKIKMNIPASEIKKVLDPDNFIRTRSTPGSTNPNEVNRMAEDRRIRWKQEWEWARDKEIQIGKSYDCIRRTAMNIVKTTMQWKRREGR